MSAAPASDYPAWVCHACGGLYGLRRPGVHTCHVGTCGVCGRETVVTEPRDFGHLRPEWRQHGQGGSNAA